MRPTLSAICSIFTGCLILSACSGIKYLPAGEKLYTGGEIKIESPGKVDKKQIKFIKNAATRGIRPKPNKTFLGMRLKLLKHNMAGTNPKGKIKKWMLKTGEAPVLLSGVKPDVTTAIIDAAIFNIGVFNGHTEYIVEEKKHTAKIEYTSQIHERYIIKELTYAVTDTAVSQRILAAKDNTVIKQGEEYNLGSLTRERIRIDDILKDQGYYYFNSDYLLFKADTFANDHTVSLKLTLKDSIPDKALTIYRINNVYIDENYSLDADSRDANKDTLRYENLLFRGKESELDIRPVVIERSVFLRKTDIYSRKNHTITLNRLMSMGNYKFIQIKLIESETTQPGFLDVIILMTPLSKYTFRAGADIVSKSNNYTGPRMNASILSRNTFKGAELMNLNLAGSFEAQLGGANKGAYSYSINPQFELTFPLFLLPFKVISKNTIYAPKTRFLLSFDYLKRVEYFDMRNVQFIYGYKWRKDIRQEHELNPVNLSYTSIGNQTKKFTDLLLANPYLARSYEEKFIAAATYSYTYNEQVIPDKKVQFYAHLTTEIGGYARASMDGRFFYNFFNKNKLAFRIFAGAARPFGSSSTLPYTKQFFSGGPNSVRAFQINSLGPGTYQQTSGNAGFLQLGGDVKLEMNAEYRMTIFRFLKLAVFADAGNIWLLKSNTSDTGSAFSFSGFGKELAFGAGLGLRIDVSFFILRFDLATPLRKPWLDMNNRWVINQMRFGDPAWRKENLILNVAIGYPF